jgi:peroxiredoxin
MRCFLALCTVCLAFGAGTLSNRRAPGFSLPDMSGKQFDLQDYRGKIVLIDIMQTNCPHCRTFAKVLDKVVAKYGGRVAVLSVVNPPDTPATVSQFLKDLKSRFPILFDCGQMAISYTKATPQNPSVDVPHLFIIDGNGWIVNDYGYSEQTKDVFEGSALFAELDRMLAARPAKK